MEKNIRTFWPPQYKWLGATTVDNGHRTFLSQEEVPLDSTILDIFCPQAQHAGARAHQLPSSNLLLPVCRIPFPWCHPLPGPPAGSSGSPLIPHLLPPPKNHQTAQNSLNDPPVCPSSAARTSALIRTFNHGRTFLPSLQPPSIPSSFLTR